MRLSAIARLSSMLMARLPDGERPPADGALPAAALHGLGAPGRPFGVYVHVPYCALGLRLLRLQHLHPGRGRAGGLRGGGRDRARPRARACSATARRRRRPSSSAAARRRCCRPPSSRGSSRRSARASASPRRRGDDRGQPGVGRPRRAGRAARGRLHPDLARHAERGAARPGDARPPPHAGPRGRRGPRGAGRGLRARQPRPDLRHAGRERRRLARCRWRPRWRPSPTTSRPTR